MNKDGLVALSLGDIKAFDSLFLKYFPKVKGFCIKFFESEVDAEDIAQEVFIKIWRYKEGLAQVENINAYIYKITQNTVYSFLRNRVVTIEIDKAIEPLTINEIENIINTRELEEIIDFAINAMPPRQKEVFCLSRKEGISNDAIAKLLNISKRTVETHISMALATLRKAIPALFLFFL